jgi:hypothetical protein
MTVWGSRLPFSLHPLIAEAKRRMRRRRLLSAAIVLVLAGSALGAALTVGRPAPHDGSAFNSSPVKAQLPPLSNLATRMAFCGNRYSTCHSPDGRWSIVYVNRSPGPVSYNYTNGQVSGYDPPRVGCTLNVTHLTTGQREQIHLRVPGCDHGLWPGHTYVVQDPLFGRLLSVDLPSRQVKVLARFGGDVVSPNGRWIAGEAELHHGTRWLIAVLSLPSQTCRVVAEGRSGPHVFGQDVAVDRSPWEFVPYPPRGFKDPVVWRTVVQGGKKISVVSGPGTGFTRNSRNIIVAKWQPTHSLGSADAIHKRLVEFNLSSLGTPCPATVTSRR